MIKMKMPVTLSAKNQTDEKAQQFLREYGDQIVDLLGKVNRAHLRGQGKILFHPISEDDILHWTLEWKQDQVSFDLNLVVHIEKNDDSLPVESVLVHRHACAPYDFAGHMPSTRMRRLNGFSMPEIKRAVEAEFAQEEFPKRRN
jgi:hypothetical protein